MVAITSSVTGWTWLCAEKSEGAVARFVFLVPERPRGKRARVLCLPVVSER